jgi:hypothetical protein
VTPVEAKQLYLAAQAAQRRVPALDTSARQLVMLTAQAAGLHGRSTTTPAMVRKRALADPRARCGQASCSRFDRSLSRI